jgi:hypothetical protein
MKIYDFTRQKKTTRSFCMDEISDSRPYEWRCGYKQNIYFAGHDIDEEREKYYFEAIK